MRRALMILSVVATIAAEAPYHLPRPAQSFNYPSVPQPPPAPAPQFPPQQQFNPNFGYNYQTPIQSPQYIQPAPQQSHGHVHSHPPPPPAQHHHHHHHHQAPAPVYIPSPAPLPLPVARPQPQPLPVIQPQPQPIYTQPSQSYGLPQAVAPRPQPAPAPVYALPAFAPQPAPQPFQQQQVLPQPQAQVNSISQVYQPISYHQQQQQQQQYSQQQYSQQQGYNYQQPQALPQYQQPQALPQYQQQAQSQFAQSAPVLSSYQADSHQYNTAQEQTHRDALDSLVVNRVQNIITDDEHSVARNAGYLSLVSGVSLEQAKPSVEITSFVHTSPLVTSSGGSLEGSSSSSSSVASSSATGPSVDYGVPSAPAPASQSAESGASFNFLPQNKPAISYGPPN